MLEVFFIPVVSSCVVRALGLSDAGLRSTAPARLQPLLGGLWAVESRDAILLWNPQRLASTHSWGVTKTWKLPIGQANMSHQKAANFSQFQESSQPLKISLDLLFCSVLLCF